MSVSIFGHRGSHRECPRKPQEYFKLTSGDLDFDNKRLTRVGAAIDMDDAATLRLLETKIEHLKVEIIDDINRRIQQQRQA